MISNNNITPLVMEALNDLMEHGIANLQASMEKLFNALMVIERECVLQAGPYERSEFRQGHANGFKNKTLHTRCGDLHLQIPQTRDVPFYPSCLEKGERTERALKITLAEMYVQGVSTDRVKKVTEELCGTEFSSMQVSRMAKILDEEVAQFKERPLGKMPYIYLDAHYEKIRHGGHVINAAVLKAVGVTPEGHKQILDISVSLSEAEVHWRGFLENLQRRGLNGVTLIISDDHSGLKAALQSVFPTVPWQRCLFHLAQNAQHYAPSQGMRQEVAQVVRDIYTATSRNEAEANLLRAIDQYKEKAPRLVRWLEQDMSEGFTFYAFPRVHWKMIRTVNVVERLNQEIKRRTKVARLFPNEASCERLIGAIAMNLNEDWATENKRYISFS
jgi:putative transposase